MDEQQLPPVNSASLDSSPGALDSAGIDSVPVSSLASPSTPYPVESIEVHEQGSAATVYPHRGRAFYSPVAFSKRKAIVISACITLVVTLLTGVSMVVLTRNSPNLNKTNEAVKSQDLTLKDATTSKLPNELQGNADSLLINGDIITRGSLKFSDGSFVTIFKTDGQTSDQTFTLPNGTGTICLDSNNCGYASLAAVQGLQGQLQGVAGNLGPSVTSLNGRSGAVSLTGGAGIIINGTVVSSSGVLSLGGQSGAVSLSGGNGVTVNGTTITNTGVVSLTSSNNSIVIVDAGNGAYDLTVGPTAGGVALGPVTAQDDPSNNTSININKTGAGNLLQFDVNGISRFVLGQNGIIGPAYGGTGVDSSVASDGQLLIGNGSGFTLGNITKAAGSFLTITNTAGGIELGNTPIDCSTCANNELSNLANTGGVSNVSIAVDLLTASNAVDLGSVTKPFGELYLAGSQATRANNFKFTGTPDAAYTLNLDNVSGKLAVVQSGSALTQAGNILINGLLSGDNVYAATSVTAPLLTTAVTAGNSANLTIRSGVAAGTSGNVSIDVGSAATKGTLSIGSTDASAITIGRSGLAASLPGGLTTSNSAINAGTGTITSGAINSQTIGLASNFTGTVAIQGADALTLGSATNVGAIKFNTDGTNFITLQSPATGNFVLTLPTALPGATSCLNLSNTGQIGTQACSNGLGTSGTATANTLAMFGPGGTSVTDSLLSQSGTVVSILGTTNSLTVEGGLNLGLNGPSGAAGSLTLRDGSNPGRTVAIQPQQSGSSYILELPTTADSSFSCLQLFNAGGGVQRIQGANCAAGGSGGNVNASGGASLIGRTLRVTAYDVGGLGNYDVTASIIRDNGTRIGISTDPHASDLFTVGSSNAFRVTDSGALIASASIASAGLIQSTASGQALTLSGAPVNSAAQSLMQLGGAIANGNSAANGGTYLGLNAPSSGAGSAADFLNLQRGGTSEFLVNNSGNVTGGTYNGLTLQSNAIGFQLTGGTAPRTLTVTAAATIDQDVSTTSSVSFSSLVLGTALGIGEGGTGLDSAPGDNTILIGTAGNIYEKRTLTAGTNITFDESVAGVFTINSSGGFGGCPGGCAQTDLGNIASVSIPDGEDLKPANAGLVDLGSNGKPFGELYLSGTNATPANNRYLITGSGNITGLKTLTLPNFTGTFTVLQSAGSAAQGGVTDELNIAGLLLAGKLYSPELKTIDAPAGSQALLLATGASGNAGAISGDITFQSGNANAVTGTSGDIVLEVGTGNTTGNILLSPSDRANVGIGNLTTAFYVSPTDSFTMQVAGHIGPDVDNTYDLGSADRRFSTIYATSLDIGGGGGGIGTDFTEGSVIIAGTGGALAEDNANFFYDNTSNFLGLGTNAPTASLSFGNASPQNINIVAQGALNNNLGTSLTVSAGNAGSQTTGAAGGTLNLNGGNAAGTGNNNGGNVTLSGGAATGTGSKGSIVLQASGGNVGVGTAAPSAILHISGSQPAVQGGGNGTAANQVLNVAGIQGGNTSNGGSTGGDGSTISMVSGAGGNSTGSTGTGGAAGTVTIATGNGGNATGNGATGTGGAAGNLNLSAGNGGNATSSATGAGGGAGTVSISAGNGGSSVGINGVTGGSVTISAGIGGSTSGAFANASGGNISLQGGAAGTGGTGAAGFIGNILLAGSGGNVGVGTATPTAQLQVQGGTISSGSITMTADGAPTPTTTFTTSTTLSLSAGDYIVPATSPTKARAITVGATGTSFTVDRAIDVDITAETFTVHKSIFNFTNTSGTSSLFGQGATGNVGIGTTAPTSKFQMVGSSSLAADGNSLVRIQSSTSRDFLTLDTTSLNNLIANPSIESPVAISTTRPYGWTERGTTAPAAPNVAAVANNATGTVAISNGSKTINGTGTAFTTFQVGDKITVQGQNTRTITVINSSTQIVVDSAYSSTASGQNYTMTGSVAWAYQVAAILPSGDTQPSAVTAISNGVGTLTAANYNNITWAAYPGATGYRIYRTTAGTSPATIGLISTVGAVTTLNDTNLSGSGVLPVVNTVSKDTTTAKTGSASMSVTTSLLNGSGAKSATSLSLSSGTQYTLSFFAQAGSSFSLTPGYYDGTEHDCTPVTVPTSWESTPLTCTFTASANTSAGYIYFKQADTTSRTFKIDAVQLETGATATTYNEANLTVYSADGYTTLLTVNNTTNQITIGSATNGITFGSGTFEPVLSGNARHLRTIKLTAEYAGAVLDGVPTAGGGSDANIGTMTAGFDSSTFTNYYNWSTSQTSAQTYDLVLRVPVPSDWSSWVAGGMTVRYNVDSTSNASVSMQVYGSDNSSDVSMGVISTSTGWQTSAPITLADAKYSADGIMTIRLRMNARTASGVNFNTKVANITLMYNSKY